MFLSQKISFKGDQLTLLSQRILTEVSFLDECYLAVWELDLMVFGSYQIYWDHLWLAQMMILFLLQHLREDRKIWALRAGEEEAGGTTLIKKNKKGTKENRKKTFDLWNTHSIVGSAPLALWRVYLNMRNFRGWRAAGVAQFGWWIPFISSKVLLMQQVP